MTVPTVLKAVKTKLLYIDRVETTGGSRFLLNKNKDSVKLPWPLLILNWRFLGLIRGKTTCFVQNNANVFSYMVTFDELGLSCRTRAGNLFLAPNLTLEAQNVSYFSLFHNAIWLLVTILFLRLQ